MAIIPAVQIPDASSLTAILTTVNRRYKDAKCRSTSSPTSLCPASLYWAYLRKGNSAKGSGWAANTGCKSTRCG